MLLDAVTIAPPTGAPITITTVPPFIDGARVGFMLDKVVIGPATPSLERQRPLHARGELIVDSPEGARDVNITGTILGRSRNEVNTLRADLIRVCRHHNTDLIRVRYTPVVTELELACVVSSVDVPTVGGAQLDFEVDLVAGDPVAYRATGPSSAVMGTVGAPVSVNNLGDVEAWPTITITGPTSGTATGLVVGNATTGQTLTLTALSLVSGEVVTVKMRPGFESIDENGVNRMANRTSSARFWALGPGVSGVYATVTGGTGAVASISWTPGWVGY